MPTDETEIPLKGGNINEQVVRVGNTVRRAQTPHSETIHRLLNHLEHHNYSVAPRFRGIDDKNREILDYLNGETDFPADLWQNTNALTVAAEHLRTLHDITATFPKSDEDNWAFPFPDPVKHQVICHNDFAPYNMVFNDGLPTGIYDFDLAGPGPRLRDVAYLAFWMAPLSFGSKDLKQLSDADVSAGSPRLKLVCESYGLPCDAELLDMVAVVMDQMGNEKLALSIVGMAATERLHETGHFTHWAREAAAYNQIRPRLAENLT